MSRTSQKLKKKIAQKGTCWCQGLYIHICKKWYFVFKHMRGNDNQFSYYYYFLRTYKIELYMRILIFTANMGMIHKDKGGAEWKLCIALERDIDEYNLINRYIIWSVKILRFIGISSQLNECETFKILKFLFLFLSSRLYIHLKPNQFHDTKHF